MNIDGLIISIVFMSIIGLLFWNFIGLMLNLNVNFIRKWLDIVN